MSDQIKKAFEVKWRVENLRSWLQPTDDSLYSSQFLAETLANTRWKLRLSRKWHLAEKCISLALERDVDDHLKPIDLNYELSFLACDGSALKSKSCITKFALNTVSQELKVTGAEILGEKKEAYLPEGVLTICCKLWKAWSTISKGGECSIRSVIGKKCVTLEGNIDYFSRIGYSNVTLNFMSLSSEISFISFDVGRQQNEYMTFQRMAVECKCFSSYSCELFFLGARGKHTKCVSDKYLATLLRPQKPCSFNLDYRYNELNIARYLKNDALAFQLEITYYPGVESECIEYADSNYKKLTDESTDLENVNSSNSEDVHSSPLDSLHITEPEDKACDIDKNGSGDEDEYFCAAGKRHLPSTTLKEDLTSLYNDCLFCDTKLRTDTETFPSHRSVLSARSPVFKKMFTTDMKEKAGECINVPDISSDTVRRMLQFLYTDCTGYLDMQSAKDLYIASDKYDIASLKKRCSSFIKKNLCPANVCDVIVLADMHQDKDLESAAHEFVLIYDKEVFGSDEWKLFMKNFSSLSAQVMYLKCMKE
ncbi:TD and POZ domain-containing protein 1-like [Araneus ventricosus]|uniref:TD and POZ domain-containing protein 1-like n=1 Tax=Araneus ventricosus TaxID=182803 RepID=A0A4Y2KHG0_ARAVE|nr:TD and POZ domain-containing protein 1-like [Araneus ventricosus]